MEVTWHDSAEADEQRLALGPATHPVCWTMVGYASGYASFCLGREIFFQECKCRGKGDRICSAVGKDRAAWGSEIDADVAYFQADDIHGVVLQLTRELKEKMKEIVRQRRQISRLERAVAVLPVEVHSAVYRQLLELARGWPATIRPCSSPARVGRARRCWLVTFMRSRRGRRDCSWRSTAARCRRPCWRASYLGTKPVRSRGPSAIEPGCSRRPTAARCSWTKSGTSRPRCRRNCCGYCRNGKWCGSGRTGRGRSTSASLPRRTRTCGVRWRKAVSAKTCSIGWASSKWWYRRCESGAKTCRRWHATSSRRPPSDSACRN